MLVCNVYASLCCGSSSRSSALRYILVPELSLTFASPAVSFYPAIPCAQLGHLKRIRSSQQPEVGRLLEVILYPSEMYFSLEEAKRQEIEDLYSLKPTVHAVPKLEPRTREQFKEGQTAWPMIFHHRWALRGCR